MDERENARGVDWWLDAATVAVAAVVERYQQPLGGYLFHLVGDLDLAVSITQETFIRCREALAADDGVRLALYRVATELALSRAPDSGAVPRPLRRLPWSESGQSGVALELKSAQRGLAQAALRDLPPGERAVLLLSDLELFPLSQVAAILGLSPDEAYERLEQARARFRHAYVDACRAQR